MSASSWPPTSFAKLFSSHITGMPIHCASTAAIEQLVTKHQASFKSSDNGTFASLGPDVPLPRGFCLTLICLSVCFLSVLKVSSSQLGCFRYKLMPGELGQTKICFPSLFAAKYFLNKFLFKTLEFLINFSLAFASTSS